MLDLKLIRDNADFVESQLARRNGDFSIRPIVEIDAKHRKAQAEWENLNRRRNEISTSFKTGKLAKEEMEALRKEASQAKEKQDAVNEERVKLEAELEQLLLGIPNLPASEVPDGKDENDNKEVSTWGTINSIKNPRHHYEIGTDLGIFDFERGVKVAESRFTVLMNWGAKFERALMNLMLDTHARKGYSEVFPPILVNRDCLVGTGQLPKFEGDYYKLADDELYLVPTAEVPVTNLYREETLDEEMLPILHCAYTPNFRREAGSAGKDTRGYIRQHQFNKVELVKFCAPETSEEEHEKLTRDAEAILEALNLPYRRVLLCSGDIGFCARKCYDLEVWFPAQGKYREISSCSNFGDFQARRAGLKYRPKDGGKARYIHTINGSGLAIGRALAAILENYQNEDGSVTVPDALVPYMGVKLIEAKQARVSV
ncbi:MAG: serine--tRNA ligase [Candidatus Obscuribacter phosphatis]|uniref:Serine--tRNA ligase n=1 Tax=Candidatus Obscuribacter phosphatis TaxID=1906157 RepID=A0A8J7TLW2_9BACT|nr:serine--tRNA ligase [Candidatus Obscuribacter phosphatis]